MAQTFTVTRPLTLSDTLTTNGNVNVTSTFYSRYRRTAVVANYTATEADELLGVTVNSNVTVTFPQISTLSNPLKQKCFTVVDERGNAELKPITIAASGGDMILGGATTQLSVDWSSMRFYSVPNAVGVGDGRWLCAAVVPS